MLSLLTLLKEFPIPCFDGTQFVLFSEHIVVYIVYIMESEVMVHFVVVSVVIVLQALVQRLYVFVGHRHLVDPCIVVYRL